MPEIEAMLNLDTRAAEEAVTKLGVAFDQVLTPALAKFDQLLAASKEFDSLTAALGGRADLEPPAQAAPPSVSLLSAARDVTGLLSDDYGDHWLNGITFEPEGAALDLTEDFPWFWNCPEASGTAWSSNSPGGVKPVPDEKPANVTVRPFMAHTADPCISTMGMFGRDAEGRAKRLLEANLPRIVENEFWTGTRAGQAGFANPFLAQAACTVLAGGVAVGYVSALAELEQAIANEDNPDGFIHCERRLATLWDQNGLLYTSPSGRSMKTVLGTTVVPGVGYPGTGKAAAAAPSRTQSWAFASGPVFYARTPTRLQTDNIGERLTRTNQDYVVRAEADVICFWDSKVDATVLVDHTTALS